MWADHPNFSDAPKERALWDETQDWNGSIIFWMVSPDKQTKIPVKYSGVTADDLGKAIRGAVKKHHIGKRAKKRTL